MAGTSASMPKNASSFGRGIVMNRGKLMTGTLDGPTTETERSAMWQAHGANCDGKCKYGADGALVIKCEAFKMMGDDALTKRLVWMARDVARLRREEFSKRRS